MAESESLSGLLKDIQKVHSLNLERVDQAITLARDLYGKSPHWAGDSTLEHVTGVLQRLLPFEPDEDAIIACILHHALLVDGFSLSELEEQFGSKVRSLVSGVHLLAHVTLRDRLTTIEDLRLMLLTVSDDVRTVLITLCDRAYLLSRAPHLEPADARRISQDALQLFAPVAARLGIYSLKHELENRAFPLLYPNDAERIAEQVDAIHHQHGSFLDDTVAQVSAYLHAHGIPCEVQAREKQSYSLFAKMRGRNLTHVSDVYDFYALRVVVANIDQCYQALGLLHTMARPVVSRFKDYISFPKPNGYQSLHTTLINVPGANEDVMIEAQVRTEQMQREAEYGIAAHWSYKAYGSTALAAERAQLSQMMASQQTLEHEGDVHLADQIFVLTPRGDIIELPEGATPLDFAFRLHTDLGLAFRGAKVNGTIVPITHQLENGDVVEIMRYKTPQPSPEWLQLLRMSSARSKLKRYIYAQQRPELIVRGKELVNELLADHGLPSLDHDLSILRHCDDQVLSVQQREDLLMKIGQGSEKAAGLLMRVQALRDLHIRSSQNAAETVVPMEKRKVHLEGEVPMPTRFAKCCKPDEGVRSDITGVISRRVIVVHRRKCRMLKNSNKERRVKAWWE